MAQSEMQIDDVARRTVGRTIVLLIVLIGGLILFTTTRPLMVAAYLLVDIGLHLIPLTLRRREVLNVRSERYMRVGISFISVVAIQIVAGPQAPAWLWVLLAIVPMPLFAPSLMAGIVMSGLVVLTTAVTRWTLVQDPLDLLFVLVASVCLAIAFNFMMRSLMLSLRELRLTVRQVQQAKDRAERSQKLAAMGRLASGIAHDFNNLLSVILSSSELASLDIANDNPAAVELSQIRAAAIKGATLTRQLLAFSRQERVESQAVNLNEVVHNMTGMVRRTIGEDIDLKVDLSPDVPQAWMNSGQLEQVVLNLVVNARDAMPRGGVLSLRTSLQKMSGAEPGSQLPAGYYVALEVTDTGGGVEASIIERIWEPFFTTKELGQGAGMGLATCYGIVTNAHGSIDVDSEPGQGATFTVLLPVSSRIATAADAQGPAVEARDGAGQAVLLVEDEAIVRSTLKRILIHNGFVVHEAGTAEQALQLLPKLDDLALLLTDVIMPGMRGPELAQRVRESRPEVPVVFMSGYAPMEEADMIAAAPGALFIQKPCTHDELMEIMHRAIAATPD